VSSCCTRKRTKKDLLFLPKAITLTIGLFVLLISVEMSVAYMFGFI
tara:strand:+ start:446 stop:583 length:138 start_codon:yes stop_codon:yes gene_type:complete